MSSSITAANGVVVVTQVFAQDENKKLSVPVTTETPQVMVVRSSVVAEKVPEMTKVFLRGQPQSLGIVQIFIGLVCMIFSMSALLSPTQLVHGPFLLAATFVVSGSLALAACKGTSPCLIKTTLALNVISALVAVAAVAYTCFILATRTNENFCDTDVDDNIDYGWESGRGRCRQMMWQLNQVLGGIRGLVLVLCVLEVCVSITMCVFSGLALGRRGATKLYRPPVMVAADSDVALLDGSDDQSVSIPPPYSP